jgi:hypothetical protein
MPSLTSRLSDLFEKFDYRWRFDGKLLVPNEKDLAGALDKAREALYAEPIPSQLEVGRLLIKHENEETFAVYLYIGDL